MLTETQDEIIFAINKNSMKEIEIGITQTSNQIQLEIDSLNAVKTSKLNKLKLHLEKEELTEIYKLLANEKDDTLKSEFFQANKIDPAQFAFEEDLLKYFKELMNDQSSYTKISCKEVELSFKFFEKLLYIRMYKEFDVNIMDLIALIYENQKYPMWFPFCQSSDTLSQVSKAKKAIYMISHFPVISNRDFLVYGFGVNCLKSEGVIYLLVKTINEDCGVFQDFFKMKENNKFVRADLKIFGFEIKVLGKNKIALNGVINCDPKVKFVPSWLINQVVKQFAKNLFNKLIEVVKNYRGSKYENKVPSQMDKNFYDFLRNEIQENFGII